MVEGTKRVPSLLTLFADHSIVEDSRHMLRWPLILGLFVGCVRADKGNEGEDEDEAETVLKNVNEKSSCYWEHRSCHEPEKCVWLLGVWL